MFRQNHTSQFSTLLPQYTESYRYSFQGQESYHEIKGIGNSIEFEYRMHDPRLGRFLSIDPLAYMYPANSTFAFAENDVIRAIDIEGQEKGIVSHSGAASSWFVVDLSNPAFEDVKGKIELKIGHQLSSTDVVRMNIYYYADKQQGYVESSVTDASGNVLYMDKKNFDNRGFWTILMREGPFNAFGGAGTGENIDAYYRKPENGMKLAASTAGFWIAGFYFGWLNAAEFGADEISDAQKSISQSTKPAFKKYIWDDARDTHIFRKKGGHLEVASEANKKMFLDIANGGGEFLGIDEHGNEWFHKMNDDGTQTWVETRNGKVLNAGINNPDDIRTFNSKTGLSNKEKPKNFNPRNKKKGS